MAIQIGRLLHFGFVATRLVVLFGFVLDDRVMHVRGLLFPLGDDLFRFGLTALVGISGFSVLLVAFVGVGSLSVLLIAFIRFGGFGILIGLALVGLVRRGGVFRIGLGIGCGGLISRCGNRPARPCP